ncbi:PilN family type IVB pilus formation outer membrane protein (plasmid) [Edwardsiella piscicida]|uniref:PilN family type IVB pilus formation outer membrane protein n=1 Tax=Edwardsiella TaxID=635 RepID=UPI001F01E511|nr:PilN family type IVB pilus formation outer membrane protein [Edwardsiella piscicida]UJT80926.1 PilN family type IVB pilus formation outer membrane protein [Edwardsiella piscicida]
MKKHRQLSGVAAILYLLLSGCSMFERIDKIDNTVSHDETLAQKHLQSATNSPVVRDLSSQWINPWPINAKPSGTNHLPPCAIAINRPGVITLAEIGAYISKRCRIPVVITPDAMAMLTPSGKTEQMSGPIPAPDATGMVPLSTLGGASSRPITMTATGSTLKGFFWQGEVGGALDSATTRLGLSWRYEQGRIAIFYLDTRSFPIRFQDSDTDFTSRSVYGASSGNNGSGASTEGNSSQTTVTKMKTNRYQEIADTVKSMLTPDVGRMSMSTGLVMVTDTPRVLNAVQAYIDGRNKELVRQVVLDVKVYSVTKKSQDQLGIDWAAVFKSGSVGLSLGNTMAGAATSAMTGGVSILDGKFANSNAFIHALAQQANVSVVTQNSSITMNMIPVRVQVVTQQDYLSQVTSENTPNVGTSTSVQKDTISTGFNMTLLPYILPSSDQMELQYSVSLSDDPDMQSEKVGEVTLKLPKTKINNFAQSTLLHSGQTLLLSGHYKQGNSVNRQGVGSPGFFGLGGGITGEKDNAMLVILITPTLQR